MGSQADVIAGKCNGQLMKNALYQGQAYEEGGDNREHVATSLWYLQMRGVVNGFGVDMMRGLRRFLKPPPGALIPSDYDWFSVEAQFMHTGAMKTLLTNGVMGYVDPETKVPQFLLKYGWVDDHDVQCFEVCLSSLQLVFFFNSHGMSQNVMKVFEKHLPSSSTPSNRKIHRSTEQRSRHTVEYLMAVFIANSFLCLNLSNTFPNDTKKMGQKDAWLDFWQHLMCEGGSEKIKELLQMGDEFHFEFRQLVVETWKKVATKQTGRRGIPNDLSSKWVRHGTPDYLELPFLEFIIDGLLPVSVSYEHSVVGVFSSRERSSNSTISGEVTRWSLP